MIFIGEFVGTFLLILLGNGSVANVLLKGSKGEGSGWIVITSAWGFGVAISVYVVGWMSGGHLNPAITLSFALIGKTSWSAVPFYLLGQMLGAMLGSFFVWLTYLLQWDQTEDGEKKLLCFCTKPILRHQGANFLTEVIGTGVLLIGALGILDQHQHFGEGFAPYLIGILVFVIGLALGGPTGFAINPARDLGPRIMYAILPIRGKKDPDWQYAYIPILAPLVGGFLGALCYHGVWTLL